MTAYPGMKNYVFSRTIRKSPSEQVKIIAENVGEFVRELKNVPGGDIYLNSGGDLARTFFEENLIDGIILNVHPILLGAGISLFPKLTRQIDLQLLDSRTYKNGLVLLFYQVKNSRISE